MDINDIVKGGDERIKLKENGLNKYHGNPLLYESVFNHKSFTGRSGTFFGSPTAFPYFFSPFPLHLPGYDYFLNHIRLPANLSLGFPYFFFIPSSISRIKSRTKRKWFKSYSRIYQGRKVFEYGK